MASFYVGQRVKLIKAERRHDQVGMEFVISAVIDLSPFFDEPGFELNDGEWALAFQLEPILPSGHQPAELTVEELLPFLKAREVA